MTHPSRRWAVAAVLLMAIGKVSATGPERLLTISTEGTASKQRTVHFDRAALEALPQRTFRTNSPWTKQPRAYTGPLLRDVLAAAGAQGTQLHALALNEYQVEIPFDDARRFDVIVAHRIDGKPIPVRKLGPLFVIYPFDETAELRSPRYYERSIWQLKSIAVR